MLYVLIDRCLYNTPALRLPFPKRRKQNRENKADPSQPCEQTKRPLLLLVVLFGMMLGDESNTQNSLTLPAQNAHHRHCHRVHPSTQPPIFRPPHTHRR